MRRQETKISKKRKFLKKIKKTEKNQFLIFPRKSKNGRKPISNFFPENQKTEKKEKATVDPKRGTNGVPKRGYERWTQKGVRTRVQGVYIEGKEEEGTQ